MASFDENGKYIKTDWKAGDKITATKLNKIEESIEAVNDNDISRHVEADARLDALEAKDVAHDKEFTNVKNLIADNKAAAELGDYDINSRMTFLEEELNEGIEEVHNVASAVNQSKADMEAMVAEVEADLEGLHAKDDELSEQLAHIENNLIVINNSMSISDINTKLTKGGTFLFKGGIYLLNEGESIVINSNSRLIFEPNAIIKYNYNQSTIYTILDINGCENVIIEDVYLIGCRDTHVGTDGEWGYGINITASKNIKIIRPRIEKTWGDGIYIGYKWNETNPLYRTSNIEILNSNIYKCSRNGISVCSGDNILIDTAYIEGVDRIAPKAGIDIEPECGTPEFIHMSNIVINNITTKDNPAGIALMMDEGKDGCSGCKISINNHINCGGAGVVSGGDGGYKYDLSINNATYYDTPYGAIYFVNSSLEATKVFSNIKIIGKTISSVGGTYDLHSAIGINTTKEGNFGNYTFRNILIDVENSQNCFSNSLTFYGYGYGLVKNINIDNFKTLGENGSIYLQNVDITTCKTSNINNSVTSNYYLREIGKNLYTEYTYDDLQDWSDINISSDLVDGVYTINVLKNNGYYVRVNAEDDLTFSNNKTQYVLKEGQLKILKKGNILTILNNPFSGNFA